MIMNSNSIEIIPGILEKEWDSIEKKLRIAEKFASTIHVDIIDGIFVNNETFLDPKPFTPYSDHLYLELHMMVENPIQYIKPFADAGFKRFIGQIEMMPDQQQFIDTAKIYGEAGLAIDGPTSLDALTIPLNSADCFLVYTSEKVGFSGPQMLPERLEKVRQLRSRTDKAIEVDGGVRDTSLSDAKDAGATRFAATSFIFLATQPEEQYQILQRLGENPSGYREDH